MVEYVKSSLMDPPIFIPHDLEKIISNLVWVSINILSITTLFTGIYAKLTTRSFIVPWKFNLLKSKKYIYLYGFVICSPKYSITENGIEL